MKRIFASGLLLAVLASVAIYLGSALNISMGSVLFGVTIGAVLGLVAIESPLMRICAFLIGFVIAWIIYAVQALFLPQTAGATAIAVFIVIALITTVSALVRKLPFWAALLGAAAIAGAYGIQFVAAPQDFKTESVAAAGSTLFCVALGMLAAVIVEVIPAKPNEATIEEQLAPPSPQPPLEILTPTQGS